MKRRHMQSAIFRIGLVAALVSGVWMSLLAAEEEPAPVRHFVAFNFKEGMSPSEVAEVNAALVALKNKIATIVAIEQGKNNSPENRNMGFTDGFFDHL